MRECLQRECLQRECLQRECLQREGLQGLQREGLQGLHREGLQRQMSARALHEVCGAERRGGGGRCAPRQSLISEMCRCMSRRKVWCPCWQQCFITRSTLSFVCTESFLRRLRRKSSSCLQASTEAWVIRAISLYMNPGVGVRSADVALLTSERSMAPLSTTRELLSKR